jgi:hypothetical protein
VSRTRDEVVAIQKELAARGLYIGRIDGIWGPLTQAADALGQAHSEPAPAGLMARCHPEVWAAWRRLRALVIGEGGGEPVRYGPGRGLWVPEQGWVVTRGPGGLDRDTWKSRLGRTYPSFHCSSWTNFLLGWLTCRDALYTHSGNIPPLEAICTLSGDLHSQDGAQAFRGYGPRCIRLPGAGRASTVTWGDVVARSGELSAFNVFAQSTRGANGRWRWWHHTGLITRDPDTGALERIAADGSNSAAGYSGTPMDAERVDADYAAKAGDRILLYVYRVQPDPDGTYSGDGRIPSRVTLEV